MRKRDRFGKEEWPARATPRSHHPLRDWPSGRTGLRCVLLDSLGGCSRLTAVDLTLLFLRFLAYLDVQPLDLLIQGGERDAELLGGFGLVPVGAFELVDDDAALDVLENVEERRIRI